jgi:hypothetical protein
MSEVLYLSQYFPSLNLKHLSPVKNGVVGGAFVHRADVQEIKKRDPIQTKSLTSPYLIWVSYPVSTWPKLCRHAVGTRCSSAELIVYAYMTGVG